MSEQIQRPDPLHIQVRDALARRITAGEFRPGDQLPSVRQVETQYRVSANVAQRAVELLVSAKLAVSVPRVGTFVAPPRLLAGPQQRLAGDEADELVEVTGAGMEDAGQEHLRYVIPILGLTPVRPDGLTPVFRREQLTRDPDGTPVALAVSWFETRWAHEIPALASASLPVPSFGGVAQAISAASGWPLADGGLAWEARDIMDDGREGRMLGLEPGAAVGAQAYTWNAVNGHGELVTLEYGEITVIKGRVIKVRFPV